MKAVFRKELKSKLDALTLEQIAHSSRQIIDSLVNSDIYKQSKHVGVYLSMKREVQTEALIQNIFATKKSCYIPHFDETDMTLIKISSLDSIHALPTIKWNIQQPSDRTGFPDALDTLELDLIIVPGLGFTKQGSRLGRGKGYYDRFFSSLSVSSKKHEKPFPTLVGLAFECQMCEQLPTSTHDFFVDCVFYA